MIRYFKTSHGSMMAIEETIGERNGWERAECFEALAWLEHAHERAAQRAAKQVVPDATPHQIISSCGGCVDRGIVRWMGRRWHGVPVPIRCWKWWMYYEAPEGGHKGCGCLVKERAIWDGLQTTWQRFRVA